MSNSDEDAGDVGPGNDSTPDDWKHITKPGPHDVLCGRGGGTNNHPGNVKFRHMINEHKLRYLAASKVEKPKVAREVVKLWRALDPPGRFLARKDDSKKGPGSVKAEGNVWYDVGDKKAREKASQCLRERTPDVLPYVREMQRRQDLLTGQGLRMVEQQMRLRNENQANVNASMNGYPASAAGVPGAHAMSDPDINNAFSVEHFFTHGFQNTPALPNVNPDDPLSLQQMSRDPQRWDQAGFPGAIPPSQVYSNADLDPVPLNTRDFAGMVRPDVVSSANLPTGGGEDEVITLEEYMESMKEFKAYHLDSEQKEQPLLGMQSNSWVKSFHSVETSKNGDVSVDKLHDSLGSVDHPPAKRSHKQNKLDAALRKDQLAKQVGQSTRTHLSSNTHKSAMSGVSHKSAQSNMSGVSMFSDMSELSRNSKMSSARGMASSLSMMSDFTELTDLSETLEKIDLQAGASTTS